MSTTKPWISGDDLVVALRRSAQDAQVGSAVVARGSVDEAGQRRATRPAGGGRGV